jgi:hypothetical protein
MISYVRAQSSGELVRNSMRIYRAHFAPLFGASALLMAPAVLSPLAGADQTWTMLLTFFCGNLALVPITCIVSDACLGQRPNLGRSLRRTFGSLGARALLASFVGTLLVTVGFFLLVVPGILFGMWWGFAAVVVIVERQSLWTALRRSKCLGRGLYLRNWTLMFLAMVALECVVMLLAGATGAGLGFAGVSVAVIRVVSAAVSLPLSPIVTVLVVLLYYDMRARKDAYDNTRLAEDFYR